MVRDICYPGVCRQNCLSLKHLATTTRGRSITVNTEYLAEMGSSCSRLEVDDTSRANFNGFGLNLRGRGLGLEEAWPWHEVVASKRYVLHSFLAYCHSPAFG